MEALYSCFYFVYFYFSTLCLPQPSAHTLHNIFCSQLSKRIDSKDFAGAVCAVRPDIISLILGVYNEVAYHLKATPSKSHYFFNLRDVSKVSTIFDPKFLYTKCYFYT